MLNAETLLFYSVPLLSSFGLSLIVTWWVRRMAATWNIVDHPGPVRKIHTKPIPLMGGLALSVTVLPLVVVFYYSGWLETDRITETILLAVLMASIVLLFGGLLDDKYNLKPIQQIIAPLIALAIVLVAGIRVEYVTDPRGGVLWLQEWHVLLPIFFAGIWLLGMMYTTKILDGLDGLAGGIGLIGSIIIFIVSLSWNEPYSAISVLALVLAGALIGFLLFNFHPASIFLGESGSLLIGFWLGVLAIIAGSKIATALLVMGIPILDVGWAIIRRVCIEKKPFTAADRKHLHHRLLDLGWGQRKSVLFLYFLTLLFGSVALWQETIGKLIALVVLVLSMVVLVSIIFHHQYQHEKHKTHT